MVNSVVIVLGASTQADGTPSPSLTRRTLSGCAYARDRAGSHLLLCGGRTNPHHPRREAEIMADLVRESGFPDDLVVLEGQSRNTFENAIFAKRLIDEYGWSDITVVSDRYHLLRARMVFRTLGIQACFKPAHVAPKAGASSLLGMIYEVPALLWYGIRILSGHHKQYRHIK